MTCFQGTILLFERKTIFTLGDRGRTQLKFSCQISWQIFHVEYETKLPNQWRAHDHCFRQQPSPSRQGHLKIKSRGTLPVSFLRWLEHTTDWRLYYLISELSCQWLETLNCDKSRYWQATKTKSWRISSVVLKQKSTSYRLFVQMLLLGSPEKERGWDAENCGLYFETFWRYWGKDCTSKANGLLANTFPIRTFI